MNLQAQNGIELPKDPATREGGGKETGQGTGCSHRRGGLRQSTRTWFEKNWRWGAFVLLLIFFLFATWEIVYIRFTAYTKESFLKDQLPQYAIMAGSAIALMVSIWKIHFFRYLEPHLTIEHTVSHRMVSKRYAHIAVRVDLKNDSLVHANIKHAEYNLYRVAPYFGSEAKSLAHRKKSNVRNMIIYIANGLIKSLAR